MPANLFRATAAAADDDADDAAAAADDDDDDDDDAAVVAAIFLLFGSDWHALSMASIWLIFNFLARFLGWFLGSPANSDAALARPRFGDGSFALALALALAFARDAASIFCCCCCCWYCSRSCCCFMCCTVMAARDACVAADCLVAAARVTASTAAILPKFLTDIIKWLFDCSTFTASLWLMWLKSIPFTRNSASPSFRPARSAADPLSTAVMISG